MADGGYRVDVQDLLTGAGGLRTDGDDTAVAGPKGEGAALTAADACGGGPLADALVRFADEAWSRCAGTSEALDRAGGTLEANAAQYRQDDDTAAVSLNSTFGGPGA